MIVPCCTVCQTGRYINSETFVCAHGDDHEVVDTRTMQKIPPARKRGATQPQGPAHITQPRAELAEPDARSLGWQRRLLASWLEGKALSLEDNRAVQVAFRRGSSLTGDGGYAKACRIYAKRVGAALAAAAAVIREPVTDEEWEAS